MKQQTAVEQLIQEIKFARNLCDDPSAEMDIWHTLDVLIAKGEQAKKMEKEQMIKFAKNSLDYLLDNNEDCILLTTQDRIEHFFHETYGGNK